MTEKDGASCSQPQIKEALGRVLRLAQETGRGMVEARLEQRGHVPVEVRGAGGAAARQPHRKPRTEGVARILRIAYQRSHTSAFEDQEIWVTEVDGSAEYLLASGFSNLHGIGPAWSPTGEWIVYQRVCDTVPLNPSRQCREEHEVVLIPAGGELGGRVPGEGEVVLPYLRLLEADKSALWFPYWVTWSPDGTELLYMAWGDHVPPSEGASALIAVPIGPNAVPVVLARDKNFSVYGGGSVVPDQSWGIRREGQP